MTLNKPGFLPLYIFGCLLLLAIGILAFRAVRVLLSVNNYEIYWANRASEPVKAGDFMIVAIGDSTVQAIGTTNPQEGIVGRAEEFVKEQTGRNVHVTNVSKSGAKIEEAVKNQLPQIKNMKPDLVIVSIGANDAIKKTNLNDYRKNYQKLISVLPNDTTVYANTPDVANRPAYQKVFEDIVESKGLKVAKVYESVLPHRNDPRVYAGDFFHPSKTGYGYWFDAFRTQVQTALLLENDE